MEPLSTLDEARKAGYSQIWVTCEVCNRASAMMLDVLERRTPHRSIEGLRGAFKCGRCGGFPGKIWFANTESRFQPFEYIVAIWDDRHLDVEKVELASTSMADAEPAFYAIARRHPRRWVTLLSRTGIVFDSERDVLGCDG